MSRANAYTREGSSAFFTTKENSFTGIENEAKYDERTEVKVNEGTYDSLTGVKENEATGDELIRVKLAASPNKKWIIIIVAAIISAIIIGGCIAAAILLTRTGDDSGTTDPDLTTTLSYSTVHTPTASTSNSDPTGTTTIETTKASTATSDTSYPTSTDSTTTGEPTVATWLPWNDWLSCSVTCGLGIHRRYRSCKDGAFTCVGDNIETEVCTETTCPVYGKWTTWESWGSCSSSCGGGIQLRTRSCNTTDPSDLDCVGNVNQNRTCSNWNCPDCSQECTHGTLNAACDTCICENNIVTGHVVSKITGNFLSNAFVYASTAPTSVLTQTNTTGYFTLNTACASTELLIVKDGYVDTVVTIESNNVEVQMTRIALPYFTQTPRPKYRLAGEAVTMCCTAVATTGIDYYEWFKDSLLIETVESTDETMITLQDLLPSDSGNYQCRANSRYGAIMSPVARMDVKDNPDAFCEDSLQPKHIALPDGCVNPDTNSTLYQVDECVAKSCRFNESNNGGSCGNETYSCCVISETDLRTVQCTEYEVQLFVVRACGCAECISPTLKIAGTVVDFEDNSPVRFAEVWANGVFQTYTSGVGSFDFEPSTSVDQISIFVVDTFLQQYLSTTKVFQIPSDLTGILNIEIKLFKASDPVELDSAVTNTLVAGTSEEGPAIVQLEIPSNAFYNVDGTSYNGTVLASLTFLDPTNITQLDNIPGLFEFTDAEGQQGALDTYGVFNLYFRDSDGQQLALGTVIELYTPSGVGTGNGEEIKLWRLNQEAGNWDYMSSGSDQRRKRRQSGATLVGVIDDLTITDWWNYDRVRQYDSGCYYKVRLFEESKLISEVTKPWQEVEVYTTTILGNGLRRIYDYLDDTKTRCISALCDNTDAYISIFDYGKYPGKYLHVADPFPETSVPDVETIIDGDKQYLKARMVQSTDGPFFDNYDKCLSSSENDPHLRWHYGINNDDREVMTTFSFNSSVNISVLMMSSKLAWYPKRNDGYKACYLKVRLEFLDSDLFEGNNLNLKVRTTSFGGLGGPVDGQVFGWRVVFIQAVDNKTICIEFKCSGLIDPDFSPIIDYTRVKVEFDYPTNQMHCTIADNAGLDIDIDQSDTAGTFSAPIASSAESGVYFATTTESENLPIANQNANSTCHTGEGATGDPDEFLGVGVTFTCTPCLGWGC